jgi:hypothetical protein
VTVPKHPGISLHKVESDPKVVARILKGGGHGREFTKRLAERETRIKADEHGGFIGSDLYDINGMLAAAVYGYLPPRRFVCLLYFATKQQFSEELGKTMSRICGEFSLELEWQLMDRSERMTSIENRVVKYMTSEELLAYSEAQQEAETMKQAREQLRDSVLQRKLSDWEDKLSEEEEELSAELSPEVRQFAALAYPEEKRRYEKLLDQEVAANERANQILDTVVRRMEAGGHSDEGGDLCRQN